MITATPYRVRVTKRAKYVSLKISRGELQIVSPRQLRQSTIDALLIKHSGWITTHQSKIQPRPAYNYSQQITLLVAGETCTFKFQHATRSKVVENNFEVVVHGIPDRLTTNLHNYLKKRIVTKFKLRSDYLAVRSGFTYHTLKLRDQATRWGSCSSTGTIVLNWRLGLAPLWVSDYVILHELAHTKHMNHSPEFWTAVAQVMPNYKQAKRWLQAHGHTLYAV